LKKEPKNFYAFGTASRIGARQPTSKSFCFFFKEILPCFAVCHPMRAVPTHRETIMLNREDYSSVFRFMDVIAAVANENRTMAIWPAHRGLNGVCRIPGLTLALGWRRGVTLISALWRRSNMLPCSRQAAICRHALSAMARSTIFRLVHLSATWPAGSCCGTSQRTAACPAPG